MKKGVSEFIFKAIFVTVTGALILAFFFKFAFSQVSLFGRIDVRELVVSLDHELEALSVIPDSNKIMSLGREYDIQFECNEIISGDYSRDTEHIVFAPYFLRGDKLQAWTKRWKFPYSVANFYYLANEKTKFIIVYDGSSFGFVNSLKIPERFDVQYFNVNKLDLRRIKNNVLGADNVIFALFSKNANVNEIKKQIPNGKIVYFDYQNNNIRFFNKNADSFYLGNEMLIGAIFNIDNYDCVKDESIKRLGMISRMYKTKASFLALKEQREECRSKLIAISNSLDNFSKTKSKQIFYENMKNIEEQNDELEKNNCAAVF